MNKAEEKTIEPYSLIEARVETGRFAWLDIILRRWAHLLEATLFEKLGVMFEINAPPAEWMRFDEFCESIAEQQPLYIFETQSHEEGIVALGNKFAHACLISNAQERLHDQPAHLPELTPHSHKKLHLMLRHILKDFEKSEAGIADLQMNLKKVTSHRFSAKVMAPFEKCVVATLLLQGHGFSSHLTLCFPYLRLDGIAQKQGKKKVLPPDSLHHHPTFKDHFQKKLQEGDYEMVAELGTVQVQSHAPLAVGHVLPLHSNVGEEIVLKINGMPVLTGEGGKTKEHYAIKVTAPYETKKEEFRKRAHPFSKIQWPPV